MKTITSVRSTPFCSSIAQHFNAAVAPMLANDRSFDQVDTQLVDLNDVFKHGDYQIRFSNIRIKLIKYVADIQKNLPFMQQQINQLRQGETLTKNAQDSHDIHQVAEKLQLAYNKQMQLATDLTGVIHAMMDYQPQGDADSFQNQMQTAQMPQDMRDIKSYLRFDGQRDVISQSENAAADSAITLVERTCAVNK
ncbi:MAG TPA: hypothetical protein VFH72_10965 [Candidatus Baltobacteraceae bacterium]|nr:hypothetical protein [Candidatus Baltobacteraceae bacterium]